MAIPEPEVRVTRYEVSCLPRTHPVASGQARHSEPQNRVYVTVGCQL